MTTSGLVITLELSAILSWLQYFKSGAAPSYGLGLLSARSLLNEEHNERKKPEMVPPTVEPPTLAAWRRGRRHVHVGLGSTVRALRLP